MKPRRSRTSGQARPRSLKREIRDRAHSVEEQGDNVEMVLIRMDEIEAAVREWLKSRRARRVIRKVAL